ncbi:oxidoreductase protein [Spatholobus suberectus]|nr:oxidoreductase protein [Spatholobus suberectus]
MKEMVIDNQVGVTVWGATGRNRKRIVLNFVWAHIIWRFSFGSPSIFESYKSGSHNEHGNKPDQTEHTMSYSNLKNAIIAFLVPLPSILFYLSFQSAISGYPQSPSSWSTLWTWCYHHPLLLANVLFFFNVNLLFWLIGLIQSSHWMIDPYWTVIPVMLVHYYSTHPLGQYQWLRSRTVILLTWVFLIGLSLPLYVIHLVNQPLNIWDLVAIVVCISGIVIAYIADTQLHNFVSRNKELKELGKPLVPILDKGLWYYCRHPNYFGEQVWWWGLVVFAWNLGHGWTFIGALVNTMCLAYVTKLVEDRMLKKIAEQRRLGCIRRQLPYGYLGSSPLL